MIMRFMDTYFGRYVLVLIGVLQVCIGCSNSSGEATADGGVSNKPICGQTPRILVDYVQYVPDAGQMAIQVPDIAVDATHLYFVLNWTIPQPPQSGSIVGTQEGVVMRVPLSGGAAEVVASLPGGGSQSGEGLALTQDTILLAVGKKGEETSGSIVSLAKAGGDMTVLASTNGVAQSLVVNKGDVYFADDKATKKVPISGGSVHTIVAETGSLGVANGKVYLADRDANSVSLIPTASGSVTLLAENQPVPMYPRQCGVDLCWISGPSTNEYGSSIVRLSEGMDPKTVISNIFEPHGLVFDGKNFFVTEGGGGVSLIRIPAQGGTPKVVRAESNIIGMALDKTCLYWSSRAGISSLALSAADGTT